MKLYTAHFKGISISSKLIKWQTGGEFSHSAIWLTDNDKLYLNSISKYELNIDHCCLIEQWPHGTSFFDAWFDFSNLEAHTKGTPFEIWSLDMPEEEWEYCMRYYLNHIKEPYDWGAIAHFRLKSIKEHPEKSFCSEMVYSPIAEIKNWSQIKPFNVHPSLLVGLIQIAGGKLEEIIYVD